MSKWDKIVQVSSPSCFPFRSSVAYIPFKFLPMLKWMNNVQGDSAANCFTILVFKKAPNGNVQRFFLQAGKCYKKVLKLI